MMQFIIYQKIIIMKLWISFITKPFFKKTKKETFCIGGLRPWACPRGLAYTKNKHFLVFFGLKRTTPFKPDKNGKCIKTQKANNRTSLQYDICKTKLYIYILCVHETIYVQEVSTVYSSTKIPRRSLTSCFKGVQH